MCGIAGLIVRNPREACSKVLREMAHAIEHRGPDDEGFYEGTALNGTAFVGLAHRRLSIIDLQAGHQPITNEDATVTVVFNGEIYNFQRLRAELELLGHRFATQSDSETIVHAYEEFGDACVDRLRGMFAFALWDARTKRLLVARDRAGEKPLYYT